MPSKFLISIIGLNRAEGTRKCLEAVLNGGGDFELVLTNNGSTDGTGELFDEIKSRYPQTTVFHEKENTGFQHPNNRAFALASARGYSYMVCLNDDAIVPRGWLSLLEGPFRNEKVAITGPVGGCASLTNDFHGTGGSKTEYIEGSCACYHVGRNSIILPLFPPPLQFIYGEDSHRSLLMRERGYHIQQVNFKLDHARGATVQRQPEVKKRCEEAQEANHAYLRERWRHYLRVRRFTYPILVRRRFAVGDVLLTTPIIQAIKEAQPLSPLYVQTDFADVFRNHPLVKIAQKSTPYMPDARDALVVDLDMAYEREPGIHIIDAYEKVARLAVPGLGKVDKRVYLYPDASSRLWADQMRRNTLSGNRKIALLHPGPTTWENKNWPMERFAEISAWLNGRGWRVGVVGGSRLARPFHTAVDLGGMTTINKLAALMEKAQLFIGLDSFPMHCAQAMGVPTIGLFGPTLSDLIMTNGPGQHVGVNADTRVECAGSRHRVADSTHVHCSTACIESISVDRVKEAAISLGA